MWMQMGVCRLFGGGGRRGRGGRGWDLGRVAEDRAVFRELSVVGVPLNLAC
jgi:hypothetical protein